MATRRGPEIRRPRRVAVRQAREERALPLGSVHGQQCSGFGGASVVRGGYGEAVSSARDGHPWGQVLADCPMLAAPRDQRRNLQSRSVKKKFTPARG